MPEKSVREKYKNYAFSKVAAIVVQARLEVERLSGGGELTPGGLERSEARLASWEDLLLYAEVGRAAVTTLQKLQEKGDQDD